MLVGTQCSDLFPPNQDLYYAKSWPSTISSLMMTEDSALMLLSIYAHSEQTDLGIIPVRILSLDTDVVFREVDLGHGHSLFSFYLRSILLLALNKHAV